MFGDTFVPLDDATAVGASIRLPYSHVNVGCCNRDITIIQKRDMHPDSLVPRSQCEELCNEAAAYSESLRSEMRGFSEKANKDCTHYVWEPRSQHTNEDGKVLGFCTLKGGAPRCASDPEYAPNDQKPWDQCFVHPFWEIGKK